VTGRPRCPQCAAALPADAPLGELCPSCLLALAIDPMSDAVLSGALSRHAASGFQQRSARFYLVQSR
jgi:predicted amidophosphoribosyltransferase